MIYAQLVYKICLLNFRDILCLLDRIFLLRKQWGGNSANWKRNDLARRKEGLAMRGEHSKKMLLGKKGEKLKTQMIRAT